MTDKNISTSSNNVRSHDTNIVDIIRSNLETLAEYYDILDDQYRATAFSKAAKKINADVLSNKGKVSGFGKGIRDRITEIISTGKLVELDELMKNPKIASLKFLESVIGIGSVMAHGLIDKGIMNITDLKQSAQDDPSSYTSMQLIGIQYYENILQRVPRNILSHEFERIKSILNIDSLIIVGSYRRGSMSSGDLDMMCSNAGSNAQTITPQYIIDKCKEHNDTIVLNLGEQKSSFLWKLDDHSMMICKNNPEYTCSNPTYIQCDIWVTTQVQYIPHLLYATGSKNHNVLLREYAKKKGYKISQHGLYRRDGTEVVLTSEHQLYTELGLKYVKPEDRV